MLVNLSAQLLVAFFEFAGGVAGFVKGFDLLLGFWPHRRHRFARLFGLGFGYPQFFAQIPQRQLIFADFVRQTLRILDLTQLTARLT